MGGEPSGKVAFPMNWITLRWPWVALVCLIALAVLMLVCRRIASGRRHDDPEAAARGSSPMDGLRDGYAQVWHIEADLEAEGASRQLRLWRRWNRAAAAVLVACMLFAVLLVARPSRIDSEASRTSTRDIVLCLDVSGSTLPYDREVIATYADLVDHFQGERIGLSIFNSTSRTVFPLTDDYDLVKRQLSYADSILSGVVDQDSIDQMSDKQYQQISDWLEGTQNRSDVTSLIGDGLISCATMLPEFSADDSDADRTDGGTGRSASIVLATDNVLSGTPTYQLDEALDLTRDSGITVDGLYSGATQTEEDPTTVDMKTQIESHGGVFLTQSSSDSIDSLVREIDERQSGKDDDRDESDLLDAPAIAAALLLVAFAAFVLVAGTLRR